MISAFLIWSKTLSTFGCLGNRREAGHHGSSFTSARTTSPIPVLLFLFFNSFFHRLFWTNMKYYLNAKNDNRRGGGGCVGYLVLTRKWHQQVLPASRPARWQRTRRFVWLAFNSILSTYSKIFNYVRNQIGGRWSVTCMCVLHLTGNPRSVQRQLASRLLALCYVAFSVSLHDWAAAASENQPVLMEDWFLSTVAGEPRLC